MNLVFASGFLFPQNVFGIDYFNGLQARYDGPHKVAFPPVPAVASSEARAAALAAGIQERLPQGDFHIIAHSMGGLDSRTLIASNPGGITARVKSLTTLSTPHKGSPVADLIVGNRPDDARRDLYDKLRSVLDRLKIQSGALKDLTTDGADAIPNVAATHQQIRYRSYAAVGRSGGGRPSSFALALTHDYIKEITGQLNDGLVALDSAKYGEFQQTFWAGDHVDIVGYNLDDLVFRRLAFDHFAAYDELIAQLQ
jgi:triacylglycerol lipase